MGGEKGWDDQPHPLLATCCSRCYLWVGEPGLGVGGWEGMGGCGAEVAAGGERGRRSGEVRFCVFLCVWMDLVRVEVRMAHWNWSHGIRGVFDLQMKIPN